jgi:hypothetical protein
LDAAQGRRNPPKGVELVENTLDVTAFQFAHGSITTLHVAVGDTFELVREDMACNSRQTVVVVRQAQYAGIEGQSMRKQEAMQEDCDAPCGGFGDD